MISVRAALDIVDDADDLPDGAWMARLCELTGLDAGEVSAELYAIERRRRKRRRSRANRRKRADAQRTPQALPVKP